MSDQILLTNEALEKLKNELDYLKNVRRKEVSEKIQTAKEQGDLSENAEYSDAKDDQAFLNGKIHELENKINSAVIVEDAKDDKVGLGCTIKIVDEDNKEHVFTIVSFNEANPSEGKISSSSPLGSAFLGRAKGDDVRVELPKGVKKFKIVDIEC
ncbi:MAG: transcription elongation factor GreA [bacterium]